MITLARTLARRIGNVKFTTAVGAVMGTLTLLLLAAAIAWPYHMAATAIDGFFDALPGVECSEGGVSPTEGACKEYLHDLELRDENPAGDYDSPMP